MHLIIYLNSITQEKYPPENGNAILIHGIRAAILKIEEYPRPFKMFAGVTIFANISVNIQDMPF